MYEILFWLYFINAALLIVHEIDSAYWREWELFKLPGGLTGFLIIHIPLVMVVQYGIILIFQQSTCGIIISLVVSFSGIFAFFIHQYFIKKGHTEFTPVISQFILISIFIISLVQAFFSIYLLL